MIYFAENEKMKLNMSVSIVYSSFLVVAAVGMFVVDFFDHDVQQTRARIC